MKINGELAVVFRETIIERDLTIKEAAQLLHRSETVVNMILRGEHVGPKTLRRIERAFPELTTA